MKKSIFGRKFNRNKNQRAALIRGLMSSMILNERIKTTEAKAKAVKGEIEKLVTKAKKGKRDLVSGSVYPNALDKLFNDISKRFSGRPGGYTRIVKIGERLGDRATLVILEWVEGPVAVAVQKEEPKKLKVKEKKPAKKSSARVKKPVAKKSKTITKK